MADVFVSYKAEDRRRVRRLVEALEGEGLSVWWDAQVGVGDQWREAIARELEQARCVIVVWSKRSVGPEGRFVRDEAARALGRGVYLPIKIDNVDPPLGFGETQAVPLTGWNGDRFHDGYRALLSAAQPIIRGEKVSTVGIGASHSASRRGVLRAGVGAAAVASAAGWFWFGRSRLSPEAQRLVEEASEGVQDGGVELNANAIGKLRRAAEIEPDSAAVWGLLGLAYMQQSKLASPQERGALVNRGHAAAQRARTLEEDQPEALAAEILAMPMFRNWFNVERACRSALNKHPENPYLLLRLVIVLSNVGRHEECLALVDRLLPQLSVPPLNVGRIMLLWNLGRLDEAEAQLERSFALWPRQYAVWFTRFYYLLYNGRSAEALAFIKDASGRPVGIPAWNFNLVQSQADALVSGSGGKIAATLSALQEAGHQAAGFAENAAIFASFVRATNDAFKILTGLFTNRGFAVGETWFSAEQAVYMGAERNTYFLFNQTMKAVRQDRRFSDLTREIGLADYWHRTGTGDRIVA